MTAKSVVNLLAPGKADRVIPDEERGVRWIAGVGVAMGGLLAWHAFL